MKIHEAITMLEQMDQTKECTIIFGQATLTQSYPGMPFHTHRYYPEFVTKTTDTVKYPQPYAH